MVLGMTDDPRSRRYPTALARRRLMARGTVGVPNAAFAGWRIVARRDVQASVAVLVEVRAAIFFVPLLLEVARLLLLVPLLFGGPMFLLLPFA